MSIKKYLKASIVFLLIIFAHSNTAHASDIMGKTFSFNAYYDYTLSYPGSSTPNQKMTRGVEHTTFYISNGGRVFYSDASKSQGLEEGGISTVLGARECRANRTIDGYANCLTVSRRGSGVQVVQETLQYYQGQLSNHRVATFQISVRENNCSVTGLTVKNLVGIQMIRADRITETRCEMTAGSNM